jgi:hypothetical protein
VINHLEKIKGISTKTGLVESLRSYYEKNGDAGEYIAQNIAKLGYNVFDSTPMTYLLTPAFEGTDYKLFNFSVKSARNKMSKDSKGGLFLTFRFQQRKCPFKAL